MHADNAFLPNLAESGNPWLIARLAWSLVRYPTNLSNHLEKMTHLAAKPKRLTSAQRNHSIRRCLHHKKRVVIRCL